MRQRFDLPLRAASLVFFDLETTALRPDRGGRICEMAVVGPDGIRFDWTSGSDSPKDEALGRQISVLSEALQGNVVAGHNLQFDFHFLTYEAERLGQNGLDVRFIDTLGLSRELIPGRDDYQLGSLLAAFNAEPVEELHTAIGDALATRTLFWKLVDHNDLKTLSDAGMKRVSWNM
jgi:DNA polymerase III epsilon subunit-like protein